MPSIRVFVVDDHPMIRHGVAAMLAAQKEMQWVGEAADGDEALQTAPALRPDVVLADLVMPRMDGVATISALRSVLPGTRFVLMTGHLDAVEVRRAMAAGAAAYLLKNATKQQLVSAIQSAYRGQRMPAPTPTAEAVEGKLGADLSQREREMLSLMSRGLSNQDISKQIGIAMPTVKFHVTNLLKKMKCDNRTEAVLKALKHRMVSLE